MVFIFLFLLVVKYGQNATHPGALRHPSQEGIPKTGGENNGRNGYF